MCGIAGKVDFAGSVDRDVVVRMCRAIEHRGPDSRGVHASGAAVIGAQRLAIIDLVSGDQPVTNEDGSVVAALNGEIYNFPALRDDLQARGHRFRSHVDTEVLVHLYEERGDRMVDDLRGMFAFAIWDEPRRKLFCARDRAGKKPLFWARRGSRVWFASEVRALFEDPEIRPEIDPRAIDAYLALQYVPSPLSAFKDVHKLPPASTLIATEDGVSVSSYWTVDHSAKLDVSFSEAAERLREEVREATKIRLMSDVPLGAFLSGGVDSSAVVACMAESSERVKTFSIGFPDPRFDESSYARTVARHFGTDHQEFMVEPDALSIMPKMARHYGEPYGDSSAIPSFYLAELTRSQVTVALNGDGGDENFAGYTRYAANVLLNRLTVTSSAAETAGRALANRLGEGRDENDPRSRVHRILRTWGMSGADRYVHWMSTFGDERRRSLLSADFAAELGTFSGTDVIRQQWAASTAGSQLERMLDVDVHTYLPGDLLVKVDIATMAHSLEARSPLLDQRVMEFAASLPPSYKLRRGTSKAVLKAAFRGTLPDEVIDRPKKGFAVPLRSWFRNELRDMPREVLLDQSARERGWFREEAVERLIAEHQDGRADHSHRLWSLLQLEVWHREVVDSVVAVSA